VGGGRTQFDTLNPKAVTSNELYGYVHPKTFTTLWVPQTPPL